MPIVKFETDPEDDGRVIVYGKATGPELDLDQQIIDADFAKGAMADWFTSAANIRQMHSHLLQPAGKAIDLEERSDGHYITARISEPTAVKLCRDGTYQGFSVGIAHPIYKRDMAAPKGRIIGGQIVEVSLVDRPANSTTKILDVRNKFLLVKSLSGLAEEATWLEAPVPLEEILLENQLAAERIGKAADTEDEKPGDEAGEGDEDEKPGEGEKEPDADDAGKMADPGGEDMLPESGDGDGEKSDKVAHRPLSAIKPGEVRKFHDLLCAVYTEEEVKAAYPDLAKDGVALTVGPQALQLLWAMLQQEIAEDAGSGQEAYEIKELASAYCDLSQFIQSEMWEAVSDVMQQRNLLAAARADLHKLFLNANPVLRAKAGWPSPPSAARAGGETTDKPISLVDNDLSGNAVPDFIRQGDRPIPAPGEAPPASRFNHPWLAAGHQRAQANTTTVPLPRLSHVAEAGDKRQGYLDAGHQDESVNKAVDPARTAPPVPGSTEYMNAAQVNTANVLQNIHDHLAAVYSDMCSMATVSMVDNKAAEGPRQMGPDHTELQSRAAVTKVATVNPDAKGFEELLKAAVEEASRDREAHFEAKIAELQSTIDKLAGEPDPDQAAYRGAQGLVAGLAAGDEQARKLAQSAFPAKRVSQANEVQKSAALQEQQEREAQMATKIADLNAVIRSGRPEERIQAQRILETLTAPAL